MRMFILVFISIFIFNCGNKQQNSRENGKEIKQINDLSQIREKGVIKVVTNYNSTNYFVYKGRPLGYQYELLQQFANFMDIKLEVSVSNNLDTNFEDLL